MGQSISFDFGGCRLTGNKKQEECHVEFRWLAGRKRIDYKEGAGLSLAIYLINEFQDRTFTFKGLTNKYFRLSRDNLLKRIQEELDSTLILYRYTTKAKKYTDRKGLPQVEIKLVGRASAMNRYNPLDVELDIKTETPSIAQVV